MGTAVVTNLGLYLSAHLLSGVRISITLILFDSFATLFPFSAMNCQQVNVWFKQKLIPAQYPADHSYLCRCGPLFWHLADLQFVEHCQRRRIMRRRFITSSKF